MKRSLQTISVVFIAAFLSAQAMAGYGKPVPVGVSASPPTKADATHIRFFDHVAPPAGAAAGNFSENPTTITLADGSVLRIQDIVATPGLLQEPPQPLVDMVNGMLDDMFAEAAVPAAGRVAPPTHGFCPEMISFRGKYYVTECNVTRSDPPNVRDHQLEVADLRKLAEGESFGDVVPGGSPLGEDVRDFVGDGREKPPYDATTYPATIINNEPKHVFEWTWVNKVTNATVPLEQAYSHVYATSSVADLSAEGLHNGMITASYDPLSVLKTGNISEFDSTGASTGVTMPVDPSIILPLFGDAAVFNINNHFSPLMFFRADGETGRNRLTAYSAWQIGDFNIDMTTEDGRNNMLKMLLGFNFNPVAVVNWDKNHFMVMNSAVLNDIDRKVLDDNGAPMTFTWREILGTFEGGAFRPLAATGSSGDVYMPHSRVTYGVHWASEATKWNHDAATVTADRVARNLTDNPNEVFDPKGLTLFGEGVLFADRGFDKATGKPFIVTVSGFDRIKNLPSYIYKVYPGGKDLYVNLATIDPALPPMKVGSIAEPYKTMNDARLAGFDSYQIVAGNFNGDGCADLVRTFSGIDVSSDDGFDSDTVTSWFDNHEGDKVRYKRAPMPGAAPEEMFSSCFQVYYGKQVDIAGVTKCVFADPMDADAADYIKTNCLAARSDTAEWQIASVAVIPDPSGAGSDGLLVGNMNPMKIPGEDNFTAYAGLYTNMRPEVFGATAESKVFPEEYVRLGFSSVQIGPDPTDAGAYLKKVWLDDDPGNYMGGVEAMAIDKFGNISAIVGGIPFTQTRFGCPEFTASDLDTVSEPAPGVLLSLMYNDNVPGVSWATSGPAAGNIMPMWCLTPGGPPPGGGGSCDEIAAAAFPGDPARAATATGCCKPGTTCSEFTARGCCSVCYPPAAPLPPYCSVWSPPVDIAACCGTPPPGGGPACSDIAIAEGVSTTCCQDPCSNPDMCRPFCLRHMSDGVITLPGALARCADITDADGVCGGGTTSTFTCVDYAIHDGLSPAIANFCCNNPCADIAHCKPFCIAHLSDAPPIFTLGVIAECNDLIPDDSCGGTPGGGATCGGEALVAGLPSDCCNPCALASPEQKAVCCALKAAGTCPTATAPTYCHALTANFPNDTTCCKTITTVDRPPETVVGGGGPTLTRLPGPLERPSGGPTFEGGTPGELGRLPDDTDLRRPGDTVDFPCMFAVPPEHPECCGIADCTEAEACRALCTSDRLVGTPPHATLISGGRTLYPIMCERLDAYWNATCLLLKRSTPSKDELYAEDPRGDSGSSDNGGSDFGYCDKVYDSKAPYIASIDQMRPAAFNPSSNAAGRPSYIKQLYAFLTKMGVPAKTAEDEVMKIQQNYMKHKRAYDIFVVPLIQIMSNVNSSAPAANDTMKTNAGKFDLIKNAYANPKGLVDGIALPGGDGFTNFRLARGKIPPGSNRHIVFVAKAPTVPPPGEEETPPEECPFCDCEGETCTMPDTIKAVVRCKGSSNPASEEYVRWMNKKAKEILKINGDIFCEEDVGVMEYVINSPDISPADVNKRAIVGFMGTPPLDYTQSDMRPTKAVLLDRPTIFLPTSEAGRGARSMIVMPDLSAAASVQPALSSAVPLSSEHVTSVMTTETGTDVLNNVLSWEIMQGPMIGRAATTDVAVVSTVRWNMYPALAGYSTTESDAQIYPFAKVDLDQVWEAFARNAAYVKDGLPTAQFFEALKQEMKDGKFYWPEYEMFSNSVVVGDQVIEGGHFSTITHFSKGGGCGCDVTALPPTVTSIIAMLFAASAMTTGYIALRKRPRKK